MTVPEQFHGTTIVSVRRGKQVAMGGDGQVTLGNIVVKASARKVRRIYHEQILAGFAGATADAFTLFERFEAKLEKHQGNLSRAAVELAKDWRTDRILRRLEAMLAVADREASLIITGTGDVLEPEKGMLAIGSGGALAASQFFETLGRQAPTRKGEYQLLIAVLQDAIECFQKNALTRDRHFEEAEHWIMGKSEKNDAALSFEYVCSVLDLDPDSVRQGLQRWRAAQFAKATHPPHASGRSRRPHA